MNLNHCRVIFNMRRAATLSLLIFATAGCGVGDPLPGVAEDLREAAFGENAGEVYGSSGDISIRENELYYANAAYGVSSPEEILALSDSARRLVIQKLLLRRLAIQAGEERGYFGDEEAARYLAPRLEKLLEEYYFHRAAGVDAIYNEAEKLKPNDEALKELLATDPALKDKNLSVEQIRRERDVLVRRIARRRAEIARQKAVDELLKASDPLQITPANPGARP
ncbi:MAG: hypothetical protein NXI24_24950 [bacterium]|nr:hypothetical protein [bacterium]